MSLWHQIRQGLSKTREDLGHRLAQIFTGRATMGPELLESIEEVLIQADLGINATRRLIDRVQNGLKVGPGQSPSVDWTRVKEELKRDLLELFEPGRSDFPPPRNNGAGPYTVLVVGVNGVGKTTTIGKLATMCGKSGRRVLLAAGDTFRAAAIEQLGAWARRAGCEMIAQAAGADPSSVAFDALAAAKARNYDVVLVDTAGRLHTKINLMDELKKIKRVVAKSVPESPHESWLVIDATTGQNALAQARMFHEAIGLSGIVMAKLDGTAKGGMLAAIAAELKVPVRYVGVGERPEDLLEFDPRAYVDGLFD